MPSVLPPPPAESRSRPSRARRPAHALDERRPDLRVGLVGTVLVHIALVGLFFALPDDWLHSDLASLKPEESRDFEIELTPAVLQPVEPAIPPQRFVEVNPAAPDNVPDDTNLFGAQNQQVAQPVPTPDGDSNTPALDGDGKAGATAIVSGLTKEPQPPSPSEVLAQAFTPPEQPSLVPEKPAPNEAPAKATNAPAGGEQILGESDGGVGSTVTSLPPTPGAETGAENVQGAADGARTGSGYFAGTPVIDRNRPMSRPRLSESAVNARSAPTIKNEFGSKNIGAVAYSAKWSAYGEYLQRLIDSVQAQWERLILRSIYYPASGTTVKITFTLDSTGAVTEIKEMSAEGGVLAKRLCVSAISERAPYGEWTDDMIAVLGKEQEITFTFFYQ